MTRSRWAAVSYLVLVFGSGTLVGAVAQRLYMTTTAVTASVMPKTPAQAREEFLAKMQKRVNATNDQLVKVNAILDDAKRKYNELDQQAKPLRDKIDQDRIAAVLAVLNPEQQKQYITWRAEVKAKREQEAKLKAQAEQARSGPVPPAKTR